MDNGYKMVPVESIPWDRKQRLSKWANIIRLACENPGQAIVLEDQTLKASASARACVAHRARAIGVQAHCRAYQGKIYIWVDPPEPEEQPRA